nr:DUF3488 and transglutaminase-like domain-containing protein [Noviherbaspirillum autotrophicum]
MPAFQSLRQRASRPLSRPLSRDKADTLLLLFSCGLVLLLHVGHLPAWVFPSCAAILSWRGWITFRGNRMPPRWMLLAVALLAMGGVFASYRTWFGRDAGVAMLALLLTLKLLEMHAKRDLFVALFLSFFLILAGYFYSQSIGTALVTIIAVMAILTTQLSFQYTGTVPPLAQRLRLGAKILLLSAPLMLALFVLFPRIQGPLWGMPDDAQAGRSGLSDTMSPGNIARLALSDEIAFRVRFFDPVPAKSQLYWRGIVLGRYDGRTWSPPVRPVAGQVIINTRGAPTRYQVTLEPHGRRWLFALEVPRALPVLAGNPAFVTPDLQLLSSQAINERVRYDATSFVDFDLQPNAPPAVLPQWLELPPGFNPRTQAFAARLRSQANNNEDVIHAALRFFRDQGFRYTLEPPPLGRHAVDEFLFSTRAGFCEHYSGAFVVLMRASGIPARVVTGYQGGEINPADGFLTVRQSDAHAWAEVWLDRRGWVRVDPTAAVSPGRVEQNLASVIPRRAFGGLITLDGSRSAWIAQLQRLRQNWEAVTNAWNQWVLNYTPEKQRNFFRALGFDKVDWRTMAIVMLAVGAAVMASILLPLLAGRPKRDPIDAIYQSLCRRMANLGFPRAPHEGPRAYGARLTAPDAPLPAATKAAIGRFLALYETVRYGAPEKAPLSYLSQLKTLLAECR